MHLSSPFAPEVKTTWHPIERGTEWVLRAY
jgi:hypothetical protein